MDNVSSPYKCILSHKFLWLINGKTEQSKWDIFRRKSFLQNAQFQDFENNTQKGTASAELINCLQFSKCLRANEAKAKAKANIILISYIIISFSIKRTSIMKHIITSTVAHFTIPPFFCVFSACKPQNFPTSGLVFSPKSSLKNQ